MFRFEDGFVFVYAGRGIFGEVGLYLGDLDLCLFRRLVDF